MFKEPIDREQAMQKVDKFRATRVYSEGVKSMVRSGDKCIHIIINRRVKLCVLRTTRLFNSCFEEIRCSS